MADFKVQRGTATIATSGTTVTITAGTDYTAPSAASAAFIRLTAARACGDESVTASRGADICCAYISNGSNLVTSVTFTRTTADATTGITLDWEIVEYIGAGGAANEFIVRGHAAVNYGASTNAASSSAVSGVVTNAKVCCFLTGQSGGTNGSYADMLTTLAWNSGAQTVDATRDRQHNDVTTWSYAVVEFTGSNWANVQRVAHAFTAAGVQEDVTITSVGSLARTFAECQFVSNGLNNYECSGQMWLSGTTTASFQLDSQATVALAQAVMWIVSNTQTAATAAVCARYTGTYNTDGTTNITVTAVSATNTASVVEISQTNTQASASVGRDQSSYKLTTTTNVLVTHVGLAGTTTYGFAVFEWPTAVGGGGGGVTISPSVQASPGAVGNLSTHFSRD